MVAYILALIILLINIIFNRIISKKILYPPTLYSFIWLVVLFFHLIAASFNYIGIQYISIDSLIIFTIGPCVFSFGGLLAYYSIKSSRPQNADNKSLYINRKFLNVIFYASLILLPLYAYESYQIVIQNTITGDFMRDLRLNLNSGEYDRKYIYGIIFAFFYFFICVYGKLIKHPLINKHRLILSIIILLIYVILSTGRTSFLQIIILLLGCVSLYKRLKIKYMVSSSLVFVILFFIYGFLLKKGTNENASFGENIITMSENFSIYLLGGISAFDYKMEHGFEYYGGERTFRLPIAILNKLGVINITPQALIEEFVDVPFSTNVYTSYQVYIEDYGIFYILLILFLQSFFHTKFYHKAIIVNKLSFQYAYAHCLLLYPLLMSFFHDQLINLIPTWFYAFILITISTKFIYYKRNYEK